MARRHCGHTGRSTPPGGGGKTDAQPIGIDPRGALLCGTKLRSTGLPTSSLAGGGARVPPTSTSAPYIAMAGRAGKESGFPTSMILRPSCKSLGARLE